jgi:glycosyltransferase involved in cell wall biosynthesis
MKKHIVIVCSRIDLPGGIERASVNLANLLQSKGHKVTIVIADKTAVSFYQIDASISVVWLNLNFGITEKGNTITRKFRLASDILQLRKAFKKLKPDFIIGTEYSLTISSWLAARRLNKKILGWEHHHINWLKKNTFWSYLFKKIYPRLDYVICQNQTEKKLHEAFGCNSLVIPYSLQNISKVRSTLKSKTILTIGWLIKRKGVDLIPAIAEQIFNTHKDWNWKIIGKGEEHDNLQSELNKRNLSMFVSIVDPTSPDIESEYLNSSIFVMTSRFECLPMVLLEATSFGIPCVAFNCPTGPSDIIQNDENGFIVMLEDVSAMSDAIRELIQDENKRIKMGEQAYKSSERYLPEKIYDHWNDIFFE